MNDSDVLIALRDARLTGSDTRSVVGDVLKKLTIDGKGVTGGGLSFTVGNTGLGVDAGEASGTPVSEPLQTVEIAPVLPPPTFTPTQIPPIQTVAAPEVITRSEPLTPLPPPAVEKPATPELLDIPAPKVDTFLPLTVTGAVNGVPATAVIAAYNPWTPIAE